MTGLSFHLIGIVTAVLVVSKLLKLIAIYLLPSRIHQFAHRSAPDGDEKEREAWALVTGASDGIGLAFAHELAAAGFNVVLHGRNASKLLQVADSLHTQYPRRSFRFVVADASNSSVDFAAIREEVRDLHLTVLINNIGGGPRDPRFVALDDETASEEQLAGTVSLNALFPLHLTRALLPLLKHNSSASKPALVLNISTLVDSGAPFLASYSASKALVMALTRAVRWELLIEKQERERAQQKKEEGTRLSGGGGVEILGVRVGKTTSADGLRDAPSLFMPDARAVARAALAKAGYGHGIVVAHWAHALQFYANACVVALAPRWVGDALLMGAMRRMRDLEREEKKAS
ncbi:short chain dehydrogenase [Xylariaceae sp. FL0594]|nr:short chain dehydrogenase [Xylariaceae sp. FL0594]